MIISMEDDHKNCSDDKTEKKKKMMMIEDDQFVVVNKKYYMVVSLLCISVILNLFLVTKHHLIVGQDKYFKLNGNDDHQGTIMSSSWSRRAAEEAERVASIQCSGHGRAYLDGLILEHTGNSRSNPICECNSCFSGSDCSQFDPHCPADVDSGDPLFLEPFWVHHAASSAIVVAGWHRMSYKFEDKSFISKELEKHIRKLHAMVGNANTMGKFIVFGAGSTQLLNAAIYALSPTGSPARRVVASIPFYPLYKSQTDLFNSANFEWQGDTTVWKNTSDSSMDFIEFVTSPNNPDGKLKNAILQGPSVDKIFDHAYYWPHYSAILAPANEDLMIFTLSKITGHAGSRFGWVLIKDQGVYERLTKFMGLNSMGVSRDAQLRALKLLKVIMEGGGKEFFKFGHETTKNRWERLNKIVSASKRFSLQKLSPQYCTYFQNVTAASPGYAWLKCEREEEKDCSAVLKAGGIIGRKGSIFSAEDRYVRLSLIKSQDDFDWLLQRMDSLVSQEDTKEEDDGPKSI